MNNVDIMNVRSGKSSRRDEGDLSGPEAKRSKA